MDTPSPREASLRHESGNIARLGRSVRYGVRNAVAAAAGAVASAEGRLEGLVRAAVQGAADAVSEEREPTDALRQVVEGAADGLVTAAQALQLTVREAAARSRTFAREELDRAADEFGSLAQRFVDSVAEGMRSSGKHADQVAASVRDHAALALRRAWPAFAAAAATARRDPVELGAGAIESGATIVSGAAGALRREIAEQLRSLGVAVEPGPDEAT